MTIGLLPTNPVMEGDDATVCASILSGDPGTTTFPVTFSTANGMGANAALGIIANYSYIIEYIMCTRIL